MKYLFRKFDFWMIFLISCMNTEQQRNRNSVIYENQYTNLLLEIQNILFLHSMLVIFFTWILLTKYLIFSNTFISLHNLSDFQSFNDASISIKIVIYVMQNAFLFWITIFYCIIDFSDMFWIWRKWARVLFWILDHFIL